MLFPVPGDPHFDKVVCLIPGTDYFNNYDNIYDKAANIPFFANNFISSTDQSKWGTRSIIYTSTNNILRGFHATLYSFGTEDFTVEAWMYLNAWNGAIAIAGNFSFYINSSGYLGSTTAVTNATVPTGQWVHVAVTRESGVVRLWIDGVKGAEATITTSYTTDRLNVLSQNSGGWVPNGYTNDFRVTKGIARYTTDFSVPTAPFYWREAFYPVRSPVQATNQTHAMGRMGW